MTTEAEEPGKAEPPKNATLAIVATDPKTVPNPPEVGAAGETENESDNEDDRKRYNKMEAKLRRMCTPSPTTGRVSGNPELVKDWLEKGYKRVQLVKIMLEANGDKARSGQRDRQKQREKDRERERETERQREKDRERERERERGREGGREGQSLCVRVSQRGKQGRESDRTQTRQAAFTQKLESWRKTEQFRKIQTKGGWYSETDLRKPVSEGGLAFSATPACTIYLMILNEVRS